MRVLFDTNIIIDGAVPERLYHEEALQLLSYTDRGQITGLVAPASFFTCWQVATTHHDLDPRPLFETVETAFELAPMNRAALREAPQAGSESDFEDAYLAGAGAEAGADIFVTRNEQDFAEGPLAPYHQRTPYHQRPFRGCSDSERSRNTRCYAISSFRNGCAPKTEQPAKRQNCVTHSRESLLGRDDLGPPHRRT